MSDKKTPTAKVTPRVTEREKPEPIRRRVSVPPADVSTLEWMEAQYDLSTSIRLLIHDEIERNGFADRVNRPVEQLPRRGRPPRSAEGSEDCEDRDEQEETSAAQSAPASASTTVSNPVDFDAVDAELAAQGQPVKNIVGDPQAIKQLGGTAILDEADVANALGDVQADDSDDDDALNDLIG